MDLVNKNKCVVRREHPRVHRTEPAVHFDFESSQSYNRASPPSPLATFPMLQNDTSARRGREEIEELWTPEEGIYMSREMESTMLATKLGRKKEQTGTWRQGGESEEGQMSSAATAWQCSRERGKKGETGREIAGLSERKREKRQVEVVSVTNIKTEVGRRRTECE